MPVTAAERVGRAGHAPVPVASSSVVNRGPSREHGAEFLLFFFGEWGIGDECVKRAEFAVEYPGIKESFSKRLCDRSVHIDSDGRGRGQGAAGTSHCDHIAPNSRAGIGGCGDRIACLLCSAASHDYCREGPEQQQTKQRLCSATA